MIQWLALLVSLWVVLGGSAQAQEHPQARNTSIDVNPFHLDPAGKGVLSVESGSLLGHLDVHAGFYFHHLESPLSILDPDTNEVIRELVSNRQALDIGAAIGLFRWVEVGVVVPIVVHQEALLPGFRLGEVASAGLGDLIVRPKVRILDADEAIGSVKPPVSLAFSLPVSLPTGRAAAYMGTGSVAAEPRLLVGRRVGPVVLSGAFGLRLQRRTELLNIVDHHKATLRLGAVVRPEKAKWEAGLAFTSAVRAESPFEEQDEFYGEVVTGGGYQFPLGFGAFGGVGIGLGTGVPTPTWRFFVGARWTKQPPRDLDGDGLAGKADQCRKDPEDFDEFQDDDGCPDPDNDGDEIADEEDACPDDPEDRDEFEDEDGCPDDDNDGDGLLDTEDVCPNVAEDLDGWLDDDGCPELDNDQDGVADADDLCPEEAEDRDGNQDEDGCPEDEAVAEFTRERIVIKQRIRFRSGSARLLPASSTVLDEVLRILRSQPDVRVRVEGHTDSVGQAEFNQKLSEERAAAVRLYLLDQAQDVTSLPSRLDSAGYGFSRPRESNESKEGRAANRRVEFVVVDDPPEGGAEPASSEGETSARTPATDPDSADSSAEVGTGDESVGAETSSDAASASAPALTDDGDSPGDDDDSASGDDDDSALDDDDSVSDDDDSADADDDSTSPATPEQSGGADKLWTPDP